MICVTIVRLTAIQKCISISQMRERVIFYYLCLWKFKSGSLKSCPVRLNTKHTLSSSPVASVCKQSLVSPALLLLYTRFALGLCHSWLTAQENVQQLKGGAKNKLQSCFALTFLQILLNPKLSAPAKSAKAVLSQHCSQHHTAQLTLQRCVSAWLSGIVNRIQLDEESILQLPAITYCLTCK